MLDFKKYKRMTVSENVETFRMDSFKALNLDDTPENNDLFLMAWRYGYDGGFSEVFAHLKDLVAILRETDREF